MICFAAAGSKSRPADFGTEAGSGEVLLVLKRAKD
jgi:hypothetical protein